MAKAPPRITLSASRDIPLDTLVLSQSNVRRIKAGVSIEDLAEDIARRTLLQSLTVRAVRDADGAETGMFEVPAGGRRFQALQLLVKQKRLAKTAPIPCVVREAGLAEEDSLAENIQRAPLHPLDQFRAFAALREKGRNEEEIAAAFFIAVTVVRQRLRLASVSPTLLEVYAEDGLTLDQLMAFTVSTDHARQEQVFERWKAGYTREPYAIRRMLTESTVRASDRRARFVGLDAFIAAGGSVTRDLFQADDGGWLQDAALLDRLVATKLDTAVETIRAEGWRWVEAAVDLPYGHTYGLRQLRGEPVALTPDDQAARDALYAEQEALERQFEDGSDLTEEADRRLGEIEDALAAYDERPLVFDPVEVGRAGVCVSLDAAGRLRIERGFVRPEDERSIEEPEQPGVLSEMEQGAEAPPVLTVLGDPSSTDATVTSDLEEDEGMRPLSDRLMTELTAHRTLALRHTLGEQPEYWVVGDVKNEQGASLFVRLSGPTAGKGAAGKWQDAATGQYGDLIDLIGLRCGLIRFADRADEARRFLGQSEVRPSHCRTPHRQIVQQSDAIRSTLAAQRLFAAARSPRDTLAAAYLQARGIVLPDGERWLRFHPRCLLRPDPASPVTFWPAMIAGVTDQGGSIIGVHRTFLSRDGRCKAPIASPRRALGVLHGHAVRFGAVHDLMVVGEGIETVLSVVVALPSLPAAAALSAANLAATSFPTTLRRLYIALENDTAGERAAMTLSLRAQEAGIDPMVLRPRRGDFNDDLRANGPDGVRSALRVQLAPEDVDRTMPTR